MSRVAVILPDLLQGAGLTAILERYFAPVEVETFAGVTGVLCEAGTHFDWYFTDSVTFASNIAFFLPRRGQSVVLVPGRPAPVPGGDSPRLIGMGDTFEELLEEIDRVLSAERATDETASDELSAREVQVLQLVVSGAINKEIAERLNISLNTVLTHRKNITAKLGIKTISGLTLYALMHGYISTEDMTL